MQRRLGSGVRFCHALRTRWKSVHSRASNEGENLLLPIKVTLCGCNGRVGRYIALLLKQSRSIKYLNLHDIDPIPPLVSSIEVIDTDCKVTVFSGSDTLKSALKDADIVVMAAGVPRTKGYPKLELFKRNAEIVAHQAEACAEACPRALFAVLTNPINSLVPVVSEVLHLNQSYDHNHVFGVANTNVVWASTLTAHAQKKDPRGVIVPVVGGNTPNTMVPVLSQSKPQSIRCKSDHTIEKLINKIRHSGVEVLKANEYEKSASLSTAYATATFINSLAKGLQGYIGIVECAYVRSEVIPQCKYLVTPVELGENGIKHNYGLPDLSALEGDFLKESIKVLQNDIELGEEFFKNKYRR